MGRACPARVPVSCIGLGSHSTERIYKKLFDGNIYPQNFKHYFKYKLFKNRNYIINEYDNLEDLNEVIDLIKLQGEVNKEMSYEQDTEIVNKPNFFEQSTTQYTETKN